MKQLDKITPIEEDFAKWYTDVVKQGQLMEYGPTKGSMIMKPNAYGIWENIQSNFNIILKKKSIQNVYLPLLMPISYINKEKEHIKGFAPELVTVTRIGKKELAEHFVIRPTSETLFGELFSHDVNSYSSLPIKYNQWANVVRWEKTTSPFLRSSEFLWQEGHTVHSTALEARRFTRMMIKTYAKFCENFLAISVIIGKKTAKEKFAGAISTYTIEAMMKDGKALQMGTSHYLGQNFSKTFNIQFKNKENKLEYAYQTSWGVSTRLIGGLIMTHGDNRGIIIPPKVAPIQIDILEFFGHKNKNVRDTAIKIEKKLMRKYRVRRDFSNKNPGFKASNSEIQGTPLRIEVGPRDLEQGIVTIVRRDTLEKKTIKVDDIQLNIGIFLKDIHNSLLKNTKIRLKENIVEASTYEEFKKLLAEKKFVIVPFAGGLKEEDQIKLETFSTTRCIPFKYVKKGKKPCIVTGKITNRYVLFAKGY